jgi:hypothetical protein
MKVSGVRERRHHAIQPNENRAQFIKCPLCDCHPDWSICGRVGQETSSNCLGKFHNLEHAVEVVAQLADERACKGGLQDQSGIWQ